MTILPNDYEERVYAGVLGKIIGVYLGRPFEQWSHERILAELGEIRGYVHEKLNVPLVVRLEGTNVEAGRKLLNDSKLPLVAATDIADAAQKVVAAAQTA